MCKSVTCGFRPGNGHITVDTRVLYCKSYKVFPVYKLRVALYSYNLYESGGITPRILKFGAR